MNKNPNSTRARFVAFIASLLLGAASRAQGADTTSAILTDSTAAVAADTVTYQQFYDALSPNGNWIDYPGYGYVWSPNMDGFRPYDTNGSWVSTDQGWSWNSGFSWGWAPFHYGRWFYETGYGWLWQPGYEWAPAWVVWRNSDAYCGWAPLAPGMSVQMAWDFAIPYEHWCFVDHRYLTVRDFHPYLVESFRIPEVYRETVVIRTLGYTHGRYAFASGPRVREVERWTGRPVTTVTVVHHPYPARAVVDEGRREYHVYRPEVRPSMEPFTPRPREAMPYRELPHNNGQRGTWGASAFPEARPAAPEPRPAFSEPRPALRDARPVARSRRG